MFKVFDFSLVGGVILLLGLIYCLTIGYMRGKKIWGDRVDEADYAVEAKKTDVKKSKLIIVSVIFATSVLFYITEWLPIAITSTSAAVLCIITGCITQKKAVSAVNWNIVGRLAGCLGLAKALESAGGTELIADGFQKLIGDSISPFVLFAIVVLMVQVISEVMSNSTAILIVLPMVLTIAPMHGLNPYTFALGITLGSGIALSSPLASSTLGMSMVIGYRFNDYFRYSIFFDILAYLTIITLVPLLYGLTI